MDIEQILRRGVECGASDIFVVAGLPLTYKVQGEQVRDTERYTPQDTEAFASEVYRLAGREPRCITGGETDDDFSFSLSGIGRFRVNMFRQRGSIAAGGAGDFLWTAYGGGDAHSPEVMRVAELKKGIVLVAGLCRIGKIHHAGLPD